MSIIDLALFSALIASSLGFSAAVWRNVFVMFFVTFSLIMAIVGPSVVEQIMSFVVPGVMALIGIEILLNLLLDINYTYSMTRGLTASPISAALDNPTQRPYEYGWLYIDRPHVIKASAAYLLPLGFQIGGTFNFTTGSRFDRRYSGKDGGYNNFVAEIGTFDSINPWWSLDIKVMYKLTLPYGRLFVSAELSNVTNNRQATGISSGVLDSAGEYYASGRQAPMNLELGLGYEF